MNQIQYITVTDTERSQWMQMAKNAEETDRTVTALNIYQWRNADKLPIDVYDNLSSMFRKWLIGGWKEVFSNNSKIK